MRRCVGSLRSVPDDLLLARVKELVLAERGRTVELLVHLGELDRRRLFRDAGFSSLYHYCHAGLGMSEDEALRRIRVARAARRFPVVLELVEDGRHHLSSIALLAPHLQPGNAEELLRTTERYSNAQVRLLIAERFPRPDVPTLIRPILPPAATVARDVLESSCELGPDPVGPGPVVGTGPFLPVADVNEPPVCAPPAALPPFTRIAPLSPASYSLQCTLSAAAHAKLREVQDLLGPRVSAGDMSQVLELALDALLRQLERTRRAAIQRPEAVAGAHEAEEVAPEAADAPAVSDLAERARPAKSAKSTKPAPCNEPASSNPRHIPARTRRAVWARDGGGCQFVSAGGRRCESRSGIEIDHVRPVALGGTSELGNLRLLCRAHNQLEAERRLGRAFMGARRAQRASA